MNIYIKYSINKKHYKLIKWYSISSKIYKLQKRIVYHNKKKTRQIRNLQRLLVKSLPARLFTIKKLLSIKRSKDFYFYSIKYKKYFPTLISNKTDLLGYIQFDNYIFAAIMEETSETISHYYQLLSLLWVIALIPIIETFDSPHSSGNFSKLNKFYIVNELCCHLQKKSSTWVLILKINGTFSEQNYQWLLKKPPLEKKVFSFFSNFKKLSYYKQKLSLQENSKKKNKISLVKLLQKLSLLELSSFIGSNYRKEFNFSNTNIPIIQYNNFFIIISSNKVNLKITYRILFQLLKQRGLYIKKNRIWLTSSTQGFHFLGWHFQNKKNKVVLNISRQSIRAHKFEIKKIIKTSRHLPIDKVIEKLNKKILIWQHYYSYSSNVYKVWSELNYYLFRRIWYWCKKRHKNKGSQWVYQKYWEKKKDHKFTFSFNNKYLQSYSIKKQKLSYIRSLTSETDTNF